MIAHSISLSFPWNNLPLFIFDVNVQRASYRRELPSCMARRNQSPNKTACALQIGEPRSTRQPQRIVANVLGGIRVETEPNDK